MYWGRGSLSPRCAKAGVFNLTDLPQMGHEPLPSTVGTTMFGRRVLYLPGFFSYGEVIYGTTRPPPPELRNICIKCKFFFQCDTSWRWTEAGGSSAACRLVSCLVPSPLWSGAEWNGCTGQRGVAGYSLTWRSMCLWKVSADWVEDWNRWAMVTFPLLHVWRLYSLFRLTQCLELQ